MKGDFIRSPILIKPIEPQNQAQLLLYFT